MIVSRSLILSGVVVLAAASAFAGPVLTALPSSSIEGTPGSSIGWGYSIFNDNATLWYLPSGFSAPSYSIGTPVILFDYPAIAPLATVTQVYTGTLGLLRLDISSSATAGQSNSGSIILPGNYWNGDPFQGGASIVSAAPDAVASVTARVASAGTVVPEPSTALLGLAALILAFGRKLRNGLPPGN